MSIARSPPGTMPPAPPGGCPRNQMVLGTANLAVEVVVGSQLLLTFSKGDL
jgi:hypothetical protein